jgi:hypothetical protein
MSPAEFAQFVTLAFQLVAAGSHVKVEPYCCKMPAHPRGGQTAVITVGQGGDRWVVAYDPKLIGRGQRHFWIETAFHEACHVGLFAFGTTRKEILEAEERVEKCAAQWMTYLRSDAGQRWFEAQRRKKR